MQDANFNVTALADTSGTIVERYTYTPYGQRTILTGSWGSRGTTSYAWDIGHQGLTHDAESGLVYNRNRVYHPGLGRFTQRDPIGYIDGASLYEYLRGEPLIRVDALGLQSSEIGLATAVAAGWDAAAIASTFGISIEAAKILVAAAASAAAAKVLVDRYNRQAKGKNPCDRAKDAVRQARKSRSSLREQVDLHKHKICNPDYYMQGKTPEHIANQMQKWQGEIDTKFNPQIDNVNNALKQLTKDMQDACRKWYDPTTWGAVNP